VRVVAAEIHDEERKKRETMVEKKLGGKTDFCRLWPLISPSSNQEIHLYL